jgi:hypothetical protein
LEKHKLWFDKGYSKISDQRKQAKLQWLLYPIKINGGNLNSIRHEANRHFRKKKKEYVKGKINDLTTNSKNKNIRDLYGEIIGFKRGYQVT